MNEEEWFKLQPEEFKEELKWLENESPEQRRLILKNQQAQDPLAAIQNPSYLIAAAVFCSIPYFFFGLSGSITLSLLLFSGWLSWLMREYKLVRRKIGT